MKKLLNIGVGIVLASAAVLAFAGPASAARPVDTTPYYVIGTAGTNADGSVYFDETVNIALVVGGTFNPADPFAGSQQFHVTNGIQSIRLGVGAGNTATVNLGQRVVGQVVTVTNETTGVVTEVVVGQYDKLAGTQNKFVLYGDTSLSPVSSKVALG